MACNQQIETRAQPPHLLIVEDEAQMMSLLTDILSSSYSISTAETVKTALEKSYDELPDLILCDLKLPDGSGLNILQTLKQDEITAHIPILVISSLNSPEDILAGLEHGADDYIAKPFSNEELLHRVKNRLINRQRIVNWCHSQFLSSQSASRNEMPSKEQLFLEKLGCAAESLLQNGELTTDSLASEMAHSKRQLQRKVKEYLDCSCSSYIFGLRMNYAEALSSKGYSSREITAKVGYKDVAHFSRIFKKYLDEKDSKSND